MQVASQSELLHFVLQLSLLGVYAVCAVAVGLTIVGAVAFWRAAGGSDAAWAFTRLLERGEAVKMLTIILIVLSVTMLALLGKLESQGVIGILSGIGGYVLGGLQRSPQASPGGSKPIANNAGV